MRDIDAESHESLQALVVESGFVPPCLIDKTPLFRDAGLQSALLCHGTLLIYTYLHERSVPDRSNMTLVSE